MRVLSIKVPIRKKSGNLFNDPRNNRMQSMQNNFGVKYGNWNNIAEKLNDEYNEKEPQELEECPESNINMESLRVTLRKYRIRKLQTMMV